MLLHRFLQLSVVIVTLPRVAGLTKRSKVVSYVDPG